MIFSKMPEYAVWKAMKSRCFNPNNKRYKDYGGRGIVVCEKWKTSFCFFIADMGVRPDNKHSIDRINNNGNYAPGNCKWSTPKEQANNRRQGEYVTYKGVTRNIKDWAIELSINYSTLRSRIQKGWPVERALRSKLWVNQYDDPYLDKVEVAKKGKSSPGVSNPPASSQGEDIF